MNERLQAPVSVPEEGSMDVIVQKAELKTVIGVRSMVPVHELPEFAFAGKSNVGKSSLINALLNRKALARTSSVPGKTQTINYYEAVFLQKDPERKQSLFLVDLPGYGYTKASPEARASWGKMVERYLKYSKSLRQVFLLVDSRHAPSENDCMMHDWIIENGFLPAVVATKLDKLKKKEISASLSLIRTTLKMKDEEILIPFSAETKTGSSDIYQLILTSTFSGGKNG